MTRGQVSTFTASVISGLGAVSIFYPLSPPPKHCGQPRSKNTDGPVWTCTSLEELALLLSLELAGELDTRFSHVVARVVGDE
jgi:hypothetical protein